MAARKGSRLSHGCGPTSPAGATVVYRGWMMSADEYGKWVQFLQAREAKPLTSLEA
jgi:hypothetical protein